MAPDTLTLDDDLNDLDDLAISDILPAGTDRPSYPARPLPTWVQSIRPWQVTAVREIVEAYRDGADVVFLDAPVGAGKTLIGELVRLELRRLSMGAASCVYVCSDKALQDQFIRDFPYARVLKGRRNYTTMAGPPSITAEDCTSESAEDGCLWCPETHECPYREAKAAALAADLAVLNTSYLLSAANWTRTFNDADLVIVDEADMLEGALVGFSEFEVPRWIGDKVGLTYPRKGVHKPTIIAWLHETAGKVRAYVGEHRDRLDLKSRRKLRAFATECEQVAGWVERDLAAKVAADAAGGGPDPDDPDAGSRWIRENDTRTFKLLPVTVSQYGPKNLWRHGEKWLLMSGTIISSDEMADSLGLPLDYQTVTVPSPFPVENREVVLAPIANVTAKAGDRELDDLAWAIDRIVERHPGRVLVHTVSYRLAKELVSRVELGDREIVTYTEGAGKEDALSRYLSTPGAVMFAASMSRGVDLAGDACECQIVAKCPFPYLGDKRIAARLRTDGGQLWYATKTVRDIVQMTGRGVRSADDICPTYILDQQFTRNVWGRNKKLFPAYFREAVNARADVRWMLRARAA